MAGPLYGRLYSTMFLGKIRPAMDMMVEHWNKHYAHLNDSQKENIRQLLEGRVLLSPIAALPRHMILAAALSEAPIFLERYWPSQKAFRTLSANREEARINWLYAWLEEARQSDPGELISINFSQAYAGFYLTLLLPDGRMQDTKLHNRIEEVFGSIEASSPIVTQYVKYGFSGIYHLVCGEYKKALDKLRKASNFSARSGNRFADCIFLCSRAIAAARLDSYLEPEIDNCLREAETLAYSFGSSFFPVLCTGARSTICKLQGEEGKALRLREKCLEGQAGSRLLRIFLEDK